jgi:hypothetical protein
MKHNEFASVLQGARAAIASEARGLLRRSRIRAAGVQPADLEQIGALALWLAWRRDPQAAMDASATKRAMRAEVYRAGGLLVGGWFWRTQEMEAARGEREALEEREEEQLLRDDWPAIDARIALHWLERARERKRARVRCGVHSKKRAKENATRARVLGAFARGDVEQQAEIIRALAKERGCSEETIRLEVARLFRAYRNEAR